MSRPVREPGLEGFHCSKLKEMAFQSRYIATDYSSTWCKKSSYQKWNLEYDRCVIVWNYSQKPAGHQWYFV